MNTLIRNTFSSPSDEFRKRLVYLVGAGNVLDDPADCWAYGYDNSRRHALPDLVAFATDHGRIRDIVRLCNQHRVPLVPRGRGTGTTGATVPLRGGLVLALERMTQILKMDPDNRVMVVEPGITNQAIQDAAAKEGYFWPPDPSSSAYCTVGGNLAYNSAGPRAVKYGTPRENTLGLRAITGNGDEIRAGVYTSKGVVGYDLTRLLIGSEGTLAVITEATLKLTPLPESRRALRAAYTDINSAATMPQPWNAELPGSARPTWLEIRTNQTTPASAQTRPHQIDGNGSNANAAPAASASNRHGER